MEAATQPRRRDAAATRAALLAAARTLMAEHGVAGTSTREVAAAAGVNQALVYRYFGSKEKLFAEAAGGEDPREDRIATTPLPDLAGVLLEHILDAAVPEDIGELSRLVGAANDETVRAVLRQRIESAFATRLAERLDGPDAALRAELFAAVLVGVGFLRHKVGTHAMTTADRETLVAHVNRMVAPLLDLD